MAVRTENRAVRTLLKFFEGRAYPVTAAVAALIGCSFGMAGYVPVLYLLAASSVFVAVFSSKSRVMLTPVFFAYFSVGADKLAENSDALGYTLFDSAGFINMVIAFSLIIFSVILRLCLDGTFVKVFSMRSDQTFGIAALAGAFLFNGMFSPTYSVWDFLAGLSVILSFILVYLLFLSDLDYKGSEGRQDKTLLYVSSLSVVAGILIVAEVMVLAVKLGIEGKLLIDTGLGYRTFNADMFVLGWGVQNLIGFFLMLFLPLVLYNVFKNRYVLLSLLTSCAMLLTMFVICSKVVFWISIAEALFFFVVILIKGENKTLAKNLIITGAVLLTAAVMIVFAYGFENAWSHFEGIFGLYLFDTSKIAAWNQGIMDFLSAPLFGVGLSHGTGESLNMFSNMYHNIFVQFLGGAGIVGLVGFVWHLKKVVELSVRAFTLDRLFIISSMVSVLLASFFDNYFFYPCVLVYYGILLAVSVLNQEQTRRERIAETKKVSRRKPRVAFTFIEAGHGHIVPEAAVCEAFKRKYGDRAEVIETYFFRDSKNSDMVKFGRNLADNVAMMDRHNFYGYLLAGANVVFDDYISLNYCHRGRKHKFSIYKPALKAVEELDADVLFTTHWSSAFFAMKTKPHPYCIMYCPDAYSNGMFNLDSNELLLTTQPGFERASKRRMYAGGNLTKVPFAINERAFGIKGRKNELRKELGIKEDSFTVLLADGLYGASRMSSTIDELIGVKEELTIIAVFGKNEKGREKYSKLEVPSNICLRVYGFVDNMLELMEASDLFIGKSGANLMSEPTFFEKPVIVSCCATQIEHNLMSYYVKNIGNAVYIPNVKKIPAKVLELKNNTERYEYYSTKARSALGNYGAEEIADLIFERAESLKDAEL